MKEIQIGVIGCGSFGNFHLTNLLEIAGVSVVALATGNEEKLKATGARVPDARLYRTHQELFEAETGLDAVIVSITPDRHGDLERMAAERGIALYIEKPVTVSLEEARRNEEAINRAGIICSVGYHGRYNPELDRVRDYIRARKPGLVVGKWIYSLPDLAWWRYKARSGGQLVEQCTHIFDIFRYLFGEPSSVYAVGRSGLNAPLAGADAEDCSSSIVTFQNGGMATILAGCYLDTGKAVGDIGFDIYLEDSKIEYGFFTGVRYLDQSGARERAFQPVDHKAAMEAFIHAVRTKDASGIQSSYSDAVRTLEFTFAANRSLESGTRIEIPQKEVAFL